MGFIVSSQSRGGEIKMRGCAPRSRGRGDPCTQREEKMRDFVPVRKVFGEEVTSTHPLRECILYGDRFPFPCGKGLGVRLFALVEILA